MTAKTQQEMHTHKTTKTPRKASAQAKASAKPIERRAGSAREQPNSKASARQDGTAYELDPDRFDLEQFSSSLITARELWRRYPQLVQLPELTEPFTCAYRKNEAGEIVNVEIDGEEALLARGILSSEGAKESLALHEIRLLNNQDWEAAYKKIAASFTLAEADERELDFLATCQALYRRWESLVDAAAPVENLIYNLVFMAARRFVSLEDVKRQLEESQSLWREREDVLEAAREDQDRGRADSASECEGFVLNKYDKNGDLHTEVWLDDKDYLEVRRFLARRGYTPYTAKSDASHQTEAQ